MTVELDEGLDEIRHAPPGLHLLTTAETETEKGVKESRSQRRCPSADHAGPRVSPLQSLRQRLLQVGGGSGEGELDRDAATVVEDGGEVVSFRGGQDGQLVVGLTWSTDMRRRRRRRGLNRSHTHTHTQDLCVNQAETDIGSTHRWKEPAELHGGNRTRPDWSGYGNVLKRRQEEER